MAKIKVNPQFKNHNVSIISNDTVTTYPVIDIIENNLEYPEGILEISDSTKLYDMSSGGIHYYFNLDIPAKVEAANLALLRRSSALKNIFKYDRQKKADLVGLMPWLIIILLVLFK